MSVTEIKQSIGEWTLQLRHDTPREILDALTYFGHVAITPGRVNPVEIGDGLLSASRYVGVYRGRSAADDYQLRGGGMALWLGDEDDKGDVFEAAVTFTAATFAATMAGLLPPGGSVTSGTIGSVPGTYSGVHQWQTPRKALTYVTDIYSTPSAPVEWRVTNEGKLDAGYVSAMYVTSPRALLVRKDSGRDLDTVVFPGQMSLEKRADDLTTRVVLLAEGEGASIATGTANAGAVPYKDIHGNTIKMTRLSSESDTSAGNANARAQLLLNRFTNPVSAVELSASAYDIKADFVVGDYIDVYDPANGFVDAARERYWKGERINPIAIRCVEMTWPIVSGWTIAFRDYNGVWIDLSPWYIPEVADTTIVVGDLPSSLTGTGGGVDIRPDIGGVNTTIPGTPTFNTPFSSVAYQSNALNDARAAVYLTWNEPLNTDLSTITDGHHYEIRYRSSQTFSYPVTWAAASSFHWNQLQTWGRPLSNPAATSDQWVTSYVGWDTNELTIPELMVAAEYEFQIRAVDSASPPNSGAWSASAFYTTKADVIAPSTPAAPSVASSRIAIQVIHMLGKSTGGTFNLENDLDHLEVHAGGPDFFPDESTRLGRLIANPGMLMGKIPAVGTFPVENTGDIWVKVVAVDKYGNRSSPSAQVQSSATLIDSAHISDLTASKITAGTITADLLLSGSIKTAETGQRAELNNAGLQLYDAEGDLTVNLTADDAQPNFLGITDANNDTVASIDSMGNIQGQTVNASADVIIAGGSFLDDYYDPLPRGIVAYGEISTPVNSVNAALTGVMEVSFVARAGRRYEITVSGEIESSVAEDRQLWAVLDGGADAPTVSSPVVGVGRWVRTGVLATGNNSGNVVWVTELTEGLHRLLFAFRGDANPSTNVMGIDNVPTYFWVEDTGSSILVPNTAILNTGGVGGGGAPTPITTYTKSYSAAWSASYDGDSAYVSYYGSEVHQGYYSSSVGNRRSLIGFNSAQIRSDLSGATIKSIKITMYAVHWYFDAGGTAVFGTHNYDSRPGTWSGSRVVENRQQSANWPKPGKRTVTLSNTIGNEFKSGASRGIALGPGPSTSLTYYGRFNGAGMSNAPVLTITYTK